MRRVLTGNADEFLLKVDEGQKPGVQVANGILERLRSEVIGTCLASQMSGDEFESVMYAFLEETFLKLAHLRPGDWVIHQVIGLAGSSLTRLEQYARLLTLKKAASMSTELAAALGDDYTITPDLVIVRNLESDESINKQGILVDNQVARRASLRAANGGEPILHAIISCKWSLRSDRAQNARSEALNLIRNRKGRLPHIVVVTGEPSPSRLASLAIGTGDIDCMYHFALHELLESVAETGSDEAKDLMQIMTEGKRLRDISDLPLDLAV
jgi:NgoMIV restriction enzyme